MRLTAWRSTSLSRAIATSFVLMMVCMMLSCLFRAVAVLDKERGVRLGEACGLAEVTLVDVALRAILFTKEFEMSNKSKVVDLREERNARLIPRDPKRAAAFEAECDRIARECQSAIDRGEDPLPHKELLAILNGDAQTASRMRDLEDRRQRLGLRRVTPAG